MQKPHYIIERAKLDRFDKAAMRVIGLIASHPMASLIRSNEDFLELRTAYGEVQKEMDSQQ